MGSGAFFSMQFGKKDFERLKSGCFLSFSLIGAITVVLNVLVYLGMDFILQFLRALGNSVVPLMFLAVCAVLNIILDLFFVLVLHRGVAGAAIATALSQYVSGIGILFYTLRRFPELRITKRHMRWDASILKDIAGLSVLTCLQQSVMNLGILMVHGLVNSFGTTVISLGTRVALAYLLSAIPAIGVTGIWASIPIGWFLADLAGGALLMRGVKGKN